YECPFAKLANIPDTEARIRKLLANMCYVGVVAELLGLEMPEVEKAISKQFKGKQKAVAVNLLAVKAGADYAKNTFQKKSRFKVERMDKTAGKIIVEGNNAAAIGAVMAGCTVCGWYPITPSSS